MSVFQNLIFLTILLDLQMEVGIEDCLHIEFEYNKSKYVKTYFMTRAFCLLLLIYMHEMEIWKGWLFFEY